MSDTKDSIQKEESYIWVWVEPDPIDRDKVFILNENLASTMHSYTNMFPVLDDEEFQKLYSFVEKLYQGNVFQVEDIDLLVQNLFLLRSIDLQMREVKELINKREIFNCAQSILFDLIPLINENPDLFSEIDRRMQP